MSPKIGESLQDQLQKMDQSDSTFVLIGLVYDSSKDAHRRPERSDFPNRTEYRRALLVINKQLLAEQVNPTLEAIGKLGVKELQSGNVLSIVSCQATKAQVLQIAEFDGVKSIFSDQMIRSI